MKKILSVILSVIIAVSAFSVGAFAVEAEAEPTRFEKWMSAHEADNEFAIKINVRIDGFLIGFLQSNAYLKGDNFAMTVDFDGREIKAVLKDDSFLIYLTKFPFMHYKMESEEAFGSSDLDLSDFTLEKASEIVIDEKAFWVEEYIVESDGEKYPVSAYFEGDDLKKIVFAQDITDINLEVEFEILSYEVDDDVFKTPFFSFDVTFLVNFLLKFGIL